MSTLHELQRRLLDYYSSASAPAKNINPAIWGPPAWEFLDSVVDAYPRIAKPKERAIMLAFLVSLGQVLPCAKCRYNYMTFINKNNPAKYVSGKSKLRKWFRLYRDSH